MMVSIVSLTGKGGEENGGPGMQVDAAAQGSPRRNLSTIEWRLTVYVMDDVATTNTLGISLLAFTLPRPC